MDDEDQDEDQTKGWGLTLAMGKTHLKKVHKHDFHIFKFKIPSLPYYHIIKLNNPND